MIEMQRMNELAQDLFDRFDKVKEVAGSVCKALGKDREAAKKPVRRVVMPKEGTHLKNMYNWFESGKPLTAKEAWEELQVFNFRSRLHEFKWVYDERDAEGQLIRSYLRFEWEFGERDCHGKRTRYKRWSKA